MSERNLNNQTVSFEPSGIDDLYVNAAGVGALSLDEEPMMEPVAEASEVAEEGPFVGSQTSDNRGYVKLGKEEFISDNEAVKILASRNALCRPQLNRRGYRFVKRAFDLSASAFALALLLVPSLLLCAVICAASPGSSPLYSQKRVGRLRKDGSYRIFRMWKFRSMVPNADEMLEDLQNANEADGPLFKIKEDPRVIPGVGAFIRKHSIDEIPQLLNVLVGEMSLIGPRPPLPREVVAYDKRTELRLTIKPGCGGVWQASSRSDSSFEEMIQMDLDYIDKGSVGYDIKLIARTFRAMLNGRGAY